MGRLQVVVFVAAQFSVVGDLGKFGGLPLILSHNFERSKRISRQKIIIMAHTNEVERLILPHLFLWGHSSYLFLFGFFPGRRRSSASPPNKYTGHREERNGSIPTHYCSLLESKGTQKTFSLSRPHLARMTPHTACMGPFPPPPFQN